MTCIVGLEQNGIVYIGADSAAVAGYTINPVVHPKVGRNGNVLIGYTTSFRMGQLLQYKLTVPKQSKSMDDIVYMVGPFMDAVRECLKESGYLTVNNNYETGGTFLVGYKGALYHISSDLSITRSANGFDACGCGEAFALGALSVAIGRPKDKILLALEAASKFSTGVCGPFVVESI